MKKDPLEYKNKFMFDPYFIAEIGVNHENSIEKAKLMIEQAYSSGANTVKFQSYKAEGLQLKILHHIGIQQKKVQIPNMNYLKI